MVDSWYCLDQFVPEGISQVSRRSEVGNTKQRSLNTRLSSDTSAGTFAVSTGPYRNYHAKAGTKKKPWHVFGTISKKGLENRSSRFKPKNSWFFFSRGSGPPLRWGWVFPERTWILSGIQFTTHFIEIFVVETKRFVGSTVPVILTRQTCGQWLSKVAESKRRSLGNYFFERIYCMFLIPKCRGYWDQSLFTTSGLAFGEPQRNGKIRFFLCRNTFFFQKSEKSDFAIALRFSKRKSRSCVQT